jgi:hypothetical protein
MGGPAFSEGVAQTFSQLGYAEGRMSEGSHSSLTHIPYLPGLW